MMADDDREQLLRKSQETDEAFQKLITPLRQADQAHARIIKVLIVVVTILMLVVLACAYGLVRINHNSQQLAKVTALCEQRNESNKVQRDLWDFILAIPPTTPQTDQQKENRRLFILKLDDAFKHVDCSLKG
jgi:type VI protein secretion system component VasF